MNKKIIIGIIVLLVIGFGVFAYMKQNAQTPETTTAAETGTQKDTTAQTGNDITQARQIAQNSQKNEGASMFSIGISGKNAPSNIIISANSNLTSKTDLTGWSIKSKNLGKSFLLGTIVSESSISSSESVRIDPPKHIIMRAEDKVIITEKSRSDDENTLDYSAEGSGYSVFIDNGFSVLEHDQLTLIDSSGKEVASYTY